MNSIPTFALPKMKLLVKSIGTLGLLWLAACQLGCNNEAKEPSYIQIDTFLLSTDYSVQGSSSAAINTAWVYINDNPVGVYDIPCKFPVMTQGDVNLTIVGGIKANGVSSTRVQYPTFQSFTKSVSLKPDSTLIVVPTTAYYTSTNFPYKEAFESPGILLQPSGLSEEGLNIFKTTNVSEVFEGSSSGKIEIDASHSFLEIETTQAYSLPSSASIPVFLEFDYKTNSDLRIGIYAEGQTGEVQSEIGGLNPTETWKKAYIYLTPELKNYVGGEFRIYFGVLRNSSSPEVITTYLDNIKIVHP
jgi:hypothetical protein